MSDAEIEVLAEKIYISMCSNSEVRSAVSLGEGEFFAIGSFRAALTFSKAKIRFHEERAKKSV